MCIGTVQQKERNPYSYALLRGPAAMEIQTFRCWNTRFMIVIQQNSLKRHLDCTFGKFELLLSL